MVNTNKAAAEHFAEQQPLRLAMIFVLNFQIKVGRRWVNDTECYLTLEGAQSRQSFLEHLYVDTIKKGGVRNFAISVTTLHD
jgi:hypothetical protein